MYTCHIGELVCGCLLVKYNYGWMLSFYNLSWSATVRAVYGRCPFVIVMKGAEMSLPLETRKKVSLCGL